MATLFLAAAGVAGAAIAGRYMIRGWGVYGPALKNMIKLPSGGVRRHYEGGFEEKMTLAEAALILNVRQSATVTKIKQAHRKLMVLNHPDSGGSHYIATKVNEAKDLLLKSHHEDPPA